MYSLYKPTILFYFITTRFPDALKITSREFFILKALIINCVKGIITSEQSQKETKDKIPYKKHWTACSKESIEPHAGHKVHTRVLSFNV